MRDINNDLAANDFDVYDANCFGKVIFDLFNQIKFAIK